MNGMLSESVKSRSRFLILRCMSVCRPFFDVPAGVSGDMQRVRWRLNVNGESDWRALRGARAGET